jgi:hypothetical protein
MIKMLLFSSLIHDVLLCWSDMQILGILQMNFPEVLPEHRGAVVDTADVLPTPNIDKVALERKDEAESLGHPTVEDKVNPTSCYRCSIQC